MVLTKKPLSGDSEFMSTLSRFFEKADKRFDQIAKTVKKDREELKKEGNLERLAANLYASAEKGFKKDLRENRVEGEIQKPYLAIFREAWQEKQMDRQSAEILNSPELGAINGFIAHLENLPKLRECIESADPKGNWQVFLEDILGEDSEKTGFFAPVLSVLGLDGLLKKNDGDKKEEGEEGEESAKKDEEGENAEAQNESQEIVPKTPKSTIYIGDSNTLAMTSVARKNLKIDGKITEKANKGASAEWGAQEMERMANADPSPLKDYENAVVLMGTNDLLGSPTQIIGYLERTYKALKRAGVKHVYAVTVPPVGGYAPYDKQKAKVRTNKKEINDWIREAPSTGLAYRVIDLAAREKDGGIADNDDPEKLCKSAHSGDGLHFDKKMLARVYQRELELGTGAAAQNQSPQNVA